MCFRTQIDLASRKTSNIAQVKIKYKIKDLNLSVKIEIPASMVSIPRRFSDEKKLRKFGCKKFYRSFLALFLVFPACR